MAVLLGGLAGCGRFGPGKRPGGKDDPKDPSSAAVPVEVVALETGPIEDVAMSPTDLEAEAAVSVMARSANLVRKLHIEEGDVVVAGQLLVELEDDVQATQRARALSELERARADFERQKTLRAQDLVSDQAFDEARHQLRQKELALEDAERELGYTEIRAPIGGTVTRRLVKVGDYVTPNAVVLDIVDFSTLVARVPVAETFLAHLHEGQSARVEATALPGRIIEGFVKRISPVVDSASGTVLVTVALPDPGPFRPGMYVNAAIVVRRHADAVRIPKRALLFDEGRRFVFRVLPPGSGPDATGSGSGSGVGSPVEGGGTGELRRVEKVDVPVRIEDRKFVEAETGFDEGDLLVVVGQSALRDGAWVRVRVADSRVVDPEPAG